MSILKYKYKVHKLINILFYLIVFGIGFLVGFGAKKIDFNNLLTKVLMIDNVSAHTITTTNSGDVINEDFIINKFSSYINNFDINDYEFAYYKLGTNTWTIYALVKDSIYLATQNSTNGQLGFMNLNCKNKIGKYCFYQFSVSNKNGADEVYAITAGGATIGYSSFDSLSQYNENFTYDYSSINVLDFSKYQIPNMVYNENLFKDNPDFKEVCIEKGKKYGITTTNKDPISNSIFVSDFLWFPGKTSGVKYSEYDSLNDNNILIYNDEISTENYYFEDREKIDLIYNDDIISNYFNNSGYTDKYSYYGYTAYKFIHSYYVDENNKNQNMFTIFDFSNINYSAFGSAGGSSSSFGDTPLKYCFYIKNEFNVTELKNDEWNDYTGVVPTPGGNLDVNTTYNKNNSSDETKFYFNNINDFISKIKPTINFINTHILELYNSMPVIVKSFIISFLVLILIRILIGMVIR